MLGAYHAGAMSGQETIDAITRSLVDFYRPERIYLFGSRVREEAGPESDFDFLVVVPDDTPAPLLSGIGYLAALKHLPVGIEVVPWRKTDFEGREMHVRSSLPATVACEGRLLYDSRTMGA